MGVFSLSCWKPQVTAGLNSGGNLFPLLPFITQSSEGEGQKAASPPHLHKPTFLLAIFLPEKDPQEKMCAKPLPGTLLALQQASATLVSSTPITC